MGASETGWRQWTYVSVWQQSSMQTATVTQSKLKYRSAIKQTADAVYYIIFGRVLIDALRPLKLSRK